MSLTNQLRADPPSSHGDDRYLGLAWPALEWIERNAQPGMTTLETGSGTSTIVFAASGARHTAISRCLTSTHEPGPGAASTVCRWRTCASSRRRRTRRYSRTGRPEPLGIVLIDGAHSFPFPILDWMYTAPHVKVGGRMLVDDAYQPAVNVQARYLRAHPSWELETVPGHRTPVFRKVAEAAVSFDWDDHALGHARFNYLPPGRSAAAYARHYVVERTPLVRLVPRLAPLVGRARQRLSGG